MKNKGFFTTTWLITRTGSSNPSKGSYSFVCRYATCFNYVIFKFQFDLTETCHPFHVADTDIQIKPFLRPVEILLEL